MLASDSMVLLSVPLFERMPLEMSNESEPFVVLVAHASPMASGRFVPAARKLYKRPEKKKEI